MLRQMSDPFKLNVVCVLMSAHIRIVSPLVPLCLGGSVSLGWLPAASP